MNEKLSPTRIVLFEKCQRKYYYAYIENIKEPETPETVKGTIFHKIIDLFYDIAQFENYENNNWEETAKSFQQILEHLLKAEWLKAGTEYSGIFGNENENHERELKEMLKFFAIKEAYKLHDFFKKNKSADKWFITNLNRNFKPKDREYYIELEDIHGYIDKTVNLYGKGVGIVDYKTSKVEIPCQIDESHLLQLKAYAYLYEKQTGELPKTLSIYYVRTGETVHYPTRKEDIIEIEEKIRKIKRLGKDIKDYPQNQTVLCNYCYYKEMCKLPTRI